MKKYILVLIFIVLPLLGFAQEQKIIARMGILDARFNGVDFTDWSISQKNYLVLFINEDDKFCLSNVTEQGQSFGTISLIDHQNYPKTKEGYKSDLFKMRWSYNNTYDEKKGSAIIELMVTDKPHAQIYELKMVLDNMDVNVYKGYIDGSVNLSNF